MSFRSSQSITAWSTRPCANDVAQLHSAEVLLHSVDFQGIVDLQRAALGRRRPASLDLPAGSSPTARLHPDLQQYHAHHADAVRASVDVPLINIIDETALRLKAAGSRKPLLLATRYTMEHGFYAERMKTHDRLMVPDADGRTLTHNVIFDELCAGQVRNVSRSAVIGARRESKGGGCDAVILGCTEICLLLDPAELPLPGFRFHCHPCGGGGRILAWRPAVSCSAQRR